MSVELATAYVSIVPSAKGMAGAIEKEISPAAAQAGQKAGGALSGAMGKAAAVAGGVVIAKQVTDFVSHSLDAATESQKVASQTEAVIKSTGAAAGVSIGHVGDLASQLQKISGVEDEAVQTGENMLLTFTNIKGVNFDEATKTMLDLSVATGTDARTAAVQLGKALNDPVRGISALQRVGVTFTEQQREQIKAMVDAGDTAGAQRVILKELNKEFGGSAKAAGDALGPSEKFSLAWGDFQESVGTALLPIMTKLSAGLAKVADWASRNTKIVGPLAILVGGALVAAFVAWAVSAASAAVATIAAAAPVLAIIAAIGLVVAAVVLFVRNWDTIWSQIKRTVAGAVDGIVGVLGGVVDWFADLPGKILSALGDAGSWLVDVGKKILGGLKAGFEAYLSVLQAFYVDLPLKILSWLGDVGLWLLDTGGKVIRGLYNGIKNVWEREVRGLLTIGRWIVDALGDVGRWLWDTGGKIIRGLYNGLRELWDREIRGLLNIKSWILGLFAGAGDWLVEMGKALIRGLIRGIKAAPGAITDALKSLIPSKIHVPGTNLNIDIPGFADGGVVPGPVGRPQLAVVHGGELVLNRAQQAAAVSTRAGIHIGHLEVKGQDQPRETARAIVYGLRKAAVGAR